MSTMETVVKEESIDLEDWSIDANDTSFDNFVKVEINSTATAEFSDESEDYVREDHEYGINLFSVEGRNNRRGGCSSGLAKEEYDSEAEDEDEEGEDEGEEDEETEKHDQIKYSNDFIPNQKYINETHSTRQNGGNARRSKKQIQTFKCDLCDIRRNRIGSLETHVKNVHKNHLMQQCHLCDFSTNYAYKLQNHILKIHSRVSGARYRATLDEVTRDRNFECEYCDFTSKWKYTLERHVDNIHKRLVKLNCHLCGYKTMHERHLENHVRNVHFLKRSGKQIREQFFCNKVLVRFHLDNVHDLPSSHWCCLCDHSYCEYE